LSFDNEKKIKIVLHIQKYQIPLPHVFLLIIKIKFFMKKRVFSIIVVTFIAGVMSYNVSMNSNGRYLSYLALANIEALAENESGDEKKVLAQCKNGGGYCCTSHVNDTCSSQGSPDCSGCPPN